MFVTIGLRGSLNRATAQPVSTDALIFHLRMFQLLLEMVETNAVFVSGGNATTVNPLSTGLDEIATGGSHQGAMKLAKAVSRAVQSSNNRFLPASAQRSAGPRECGCPAIACTVVIDVTPRPDASAEAPRCSHCNSAIIPLQKLLYASETQKLRKPAQIFVDSLWTQDQFYEVIWKPIFQYASKAEVFDRQIYRIIEGKIKSESADPLHEDNYGQYVSGIQWICRSFGSSAARYASPANAPAARIITFNGEVHRTRMKEAMRLLGQRSVDDPDDMTLRRAGTQLLRDACGIVEIEEEFGIKVKFGLNLFGWAKRSSVRMRHNRYVKTPYSYVAIDRGIPALQGDGHMYMTEVIALGREVERFVPGNCNFLSV